jgi:hypothetical protein
MVWCGSMCRSPFALQVDVEQPVHCHLRQHVIEERQPGVDRMTARAVQRQGQLDLGFAGLAAHLRFAYEQHSH